MLSLGLRTPARDKVSLRRGLLQPPCGQSGQRRQAAKTPAIKAQRQCVLAVARRCRDCGVRLGAVEGALHRCTAALEWPFAVEALAGPWPGANAGGAGLCRVVRLAGSCLVSSATAREQFDALWTFVRKDLSHGIDLPEAGALAAGASAVLLGLRGREVTGLLWAERPAAAAGLLEIEGNGSEERNSEEPAATIAASRECARLGVALIWVRKAERRRGLATALVDAARCHLAGLGAPHVPPEQVAFSQPTDLGRLFAGHYSRAARAGKILIYRPSWE
mmetsp:Transcript_44545/g.92789  ORF Transcript_44545/g.92789 Transcript_44545/m.92789 type:complete len:277 (+) Transcript_44545:57-887(+)